MTPEEILVADARKAGFHEAGHGVVAVKFCDEVEVSLMASDGTEGGPVAGQTRYWNDDLSPAQIATIAWAGPFAELLLDDSNLSLADLRRLAKENGKLSSLDTDALAPIPDAESEAGAAQALDILRAEWKNVTRVAGVLSRGYTPDIVISYKYRNGRWG